MPVINVHERTLNASITETGKLIDGLASSDDKLWPHDRWPAMKFDRPLEVGAIGGHGPIRYTVESYKPGRYIQFRFIEPTGFLGSHRFEVEMAEHEKIQSGPLLGGAGFFVHIPQESDSPGNQLVHCLISQ